MLDGSRDAAGDVELGRHDLAGLADLQLVGCISGVDRRPAGADGRVELFGSGLSRASNCSLLPKARPPETMTRAAASWGRSDLAVRSSTTRASPGSAAAVTAAISAEPPVGAAAKALARTVMTFVASVARTVSMALPA